MEFTFKNKNTFWMQKDMTLLTGTRLHFYDLFWMSVYLNIPTTVDDAWLLYTRNFFLVHPCWLLQNSNFDFFRAFLFLYCQTQVDTISFQRGINDNLEKESYVFVCIFNIWNNPVLGYVFPFLCTISLCQNLHL